MSERYRIRVRRGDVEVEVESTDLNDLQPAASSVRTTEPALMRTPRPLSIGEFVKKIAPVKKNEVAAAIAYFLEYEEKCQEWKPDEVAGRFTEVRKEKPSNMADLLNKSDFFMRGQENGHYRLSETGVQWVEDRINNAP
jgi:hypothetical protein